MTVKVIPKVSIYICDRCGTEDQKDFEHLISSLRVDRSGTTYDGNRGGFVTEYDFCSDCTTAFSKFLDEVQYT